VVQVNVDNMEMQCVEYQPLDEESFKFEFATPNWSLKLITTIMKKRRRYLVKEKPRMDEAGKSIPVSPTIREWECIETADDHYKVKDLVDYQNTIVHKGFMGSPDTQSYITIPYGRELWIPVGELIDKYEIVEELD
jgi:hypothetical protein